MSELMPEEHILLENLEDLFENKIDFSIITEDENKCFIDYCAINRQCVELRNLFYIFYFNVKNFFNCFEAEEFDKFVKTKHCPTNMNKYLCINALVGSCLGSGKTLYEALEVSAKYFGESIHEEFKFKVSKIYDNSFSYKLLIRLRDYAQHGHLPVSVRDDFLSFNIDDIVNCPNFTINNTLKKQLINISEKIKSSTGEPPNLSFTMTFFPYILNLIKIHSMYMQQLFVRTLAKHKEVEEILEIKPELLNRCINDNKFYVIYKDNDELHAFLIDDYSGKENSFNDENIMYTDIFNEILAMFEKYSNDIESKKL